MLAERRTGYIAKKFEYVRGGGVGALYGDERKPELGSGKGLYGEEGDPGPSMGTPSPHPVNRIIDTHD